MTPRPRLWLRRSVPAEGGVVSRSALRKSREIRIRVSEFLNTSRLRRLSRRVVDQRFEPWAAMGADHGEPFSVPPSAPLKPPSQGAPSNGLQGLCAPAPLPTAA